MTGTVLDEFVQLKLLKPWDDEDEDEDEVARELVHGSVAEVVLFPRCLIWKRRAEAPLAQARTARLKRLRAIV